MPEPVISVRGARATEYGYVLFTVELSEPATDAVSVDYQAYSGTAERDVDFSDYGSASLSGTLTFGIGETVQTFTVYVGHDTLDEIDENFFVELSDPVGATFGPGNATLVATGWVLDDDGAGLNRSMAISAPVLVEGAGHQAVFTLSLSQAYATDTTFSFATFDGTARAGSDYVARSGTVTFLAGQTEAVVTVNLLNDTLGEAAESFGLKVTGAHGIGGAVGTAEVLDPDAARPVLSIEGSRATEYGYVLFTVRLSEPATDAVSVDYQAYSGTAERDVDFSDYGSASLSGTLTFGIG
ncbi:Calx-beta domain-containing protein, partial [Paracoccus fontiphilus]